LLLEGRRRGLSVIAPERPLLAPWYRLVEDGDRLLLEHGRSVVVLEGRAVRALLPELLPLLDGSRTHAQLGDALGPAVRPAVEQALALLAGHGLLVEGGQASTPELALAASYALAPREAAERLRTARIGIVGSSRLGADVARLLRRAGVDRVERRAWEPDRQLSLTLVAPAATEVARLERWNEDALDRDARWLGVRPFDGAAATVGPLVVPRESACHACLLLRLAGLVEYGADFAAVERAAVRVEAGAPFETLLSGLAAQVAVAWVGGRDTRLPGLLHVIEAGPPLALSTHSVLRVPRCPACSVVEQFAPPVPWHEAAAA
jgi:bacteriocin biosynthesis cyclodehydratase domain-containing protein